MEGSSPSQEDSFHDVNHNNDIDEFSNGLPFDMEDEEDIHGDDDTEYEDVDLYHERTSTIYDKRVSSIAKNQTSLGKDTN